MGALNKIKNGLISAKDKLLACSLYHKIFLFLSAFTLLAITVFTFTSGNWYFNSDTATANLLAEAMVREGSLFPKSWTYAQDIWVFFLHLPIALLTLFFDNYLMMHSFSAMPFIIMAVATCIYFSRKVLKSNAWIVALPLLFCGISYEYSYMVFGQCAYLPQIIYIFLTITLFVEAFDENFQIKSKIKLALFIALTAFLAFSGIRSVQATALPIIGAVVLVYYIQHHGENLFKADRKKLGGAFLAAVITFAATVIGLIVFLILTQVTTLKAGILGGITINNEGFLNKLSTLFSSFLYVFNVKNGASIFSVDRIESLIGFVSFATFGIILPILQAIKYKQESFGVKIFLTFSAVHTLEILVLYFCTTFFYSDRYLLTVQFLMFFISAHYIYKYILPRLHSLKLIAVVLILIMSVLPQSLVHIYNAKDNAEVLENDRALVNYLESKDLTHGYAGYWNANKNTVLSDGRVEILSIMSKTDTETGKTYVKPYYWLNDSKRYTEEAHSGKTFILLAVYEVDAFKNAANYDLLDDYNEVLEDFPGFVIYVYDYNVAARHLI